MPKFTGVRDTKLPQQKHVYQQRKRKCHLSFPTHTAMQLSCHVLSCSFSPMSCLDKNPSKVMPHACLILTMSVPRICMHAMLPKPAKMNPKQKDGEETCMPPGTCYWGEKRAQRSESTDVSCSERLLSRECPACPHPVPTPPREASAAAGIMSPKCLASYACFCLSQLEVHARSTARQKARNKNAR